MAKIKEIKLWNGDDVRKMCIKHRYYTAGNCEAYGKMLAYVDNHKPTKNAIYKVAKDIVEHSYFEEYNSPTKEWEISCIMFVLARECVDVHYEIISGSAQ